MLASTHASRAEARRLREWLDHYRERYRKELADKSKEAVASVDALAKDISLWLERDLWLIHSCNPGKVLRVVSWSNQFRWIAMDETLGCRYLVRVDGRDDKGRYLYRCQRDLWRMSRRPDQLDY